MSKRIIYKRPDGGISIVIPGSNDSDIDWVTMIADKDVPASISYKIVDVSEIPTDRTLRGAWDYDMSNPDGAGLTKEQFETKYPDLKGWAVQ